MENQSGSDDRTKKCFMCLLVTGIFLSIALALVLVPMSFKGLQYYEMGFRKRSTTGAVDVSKTYGGGLHLIGPDYEFKIFKADAHFVTFRRARVFASDRLQVYITANMQYFLRKNQLAMLHEEFDINYEGILKNNALDALKGAATVYSTREFIRDRNRVETGLFKAVKERLGGSCCAENCTITFCEPGCRPYKTCLKRHAGLFAEVRYFQLHELEIPNELNSRYLESLILQESTVSAQLKQDAFIERKNTDVKVKKIENEAREISQNATAQSNLQRSLSSAEAVSIVEKSRSNGLKHLYDELGLTTSEQKVAFDYLRTLRSQNQVHLAIDYQTYAAISQAVRKTVGQ